MKRIIYLVVMLLSVVSTGYCSNESFIIKELNLELIKCPAGKFMMGSPEEELGRTKDEKLHLVKSQNLFILENMKLHRVNILL